MTTRQWISTCENLLEAMHLPSLQQRSVGKPVPASYTLYFEGIATLLGVPLTAIMHFIIVF